ncbi:MAG: protoheme IX farnesyltransferase [Actinobacteria bacterium]|nr:protoheme IX farnesyltransferase [Actinomycetota bacterium]
MSTVALAPTLRQRVVGFVVLTKPRIIELLLVTTVPTQIVAARGIPPFATMFFTVVGGTLAAGGAHAVNMYVDRDIDALMGRTQNRPLVTGVVKPNEALVFAVFLEIAAFALLWSTINLISAVLAFVAFLWYVFVYTLWLKRTTTRNIVIGGVAGAIPVLIGWTSVTGHLAWPPIILFAVIVYWTPPHFWALAMKYRDEYSAAHVPMLPSVSGYHTTTVRIIGYTIVLWALTLVFGPVADMGIIYMAAAVVLGAVFLWYALQLKQTESPKVAMRMFGYSIMYISLLFGAMVVDQLVRWGH